MADAATVEWVSAAVAQATKSTKFCVSGRFPIVEPGLEVEGLGPAELPLKPRIAKPLIASCHIAPYGKGTKTLVDRDVRNTYELDPEQFRVSEAWNEAVAVVTWSVAHELGLPADRLEARLYKLLVYEKDGFF